MRMPVCWRSKPVETRCPSPRLPLSFTKKKERERKRERERKKERKKERKTKSKRNKKELKKRKL
jgi:hypothetical protein